LSIPLKCNTSNSSSSAHSSSNSTSTSPSHVTYVFDKDHFESELNANLTKEQIKKEFQNRYGNKMLKRKSTKQHSKPKFLYIPVTKTFTNPSTGQTSKQIRQMKIKNQIRTLCFHENNEPPYQGTFSKTSNIIIGNRPFRKDNKIFDYDIDNGNNWNRDKNGNTNEKYTEDSSTSEDDTNVDEETIVFDDFVVPNDNFN